MMPPSTTIADMATEFDKTACRVQLTRATEFDSALQHVRQLPLA